MTNKVPKQLKKHTFKPKYTEDDLRVIREMKQAGQTRGDIFYVMLQRRGDVSPITIGRWIDGVTEESINNNERSR